MITKVVIDRTDGGTGRIDRVQFWVNEVLVNSVLIFGKEAHVYGRHNLERIDKPK